MNKKIILLVSATTLVLTACNELQNTTDNSVDASPVAISKDDAIAIVNGKYISKTSLKLLENEIAQRGRGQTIPKEKLIEELVQRELLIQEAVKKQLNKTTEFSERLNAIKNSLLSQATIQDYIKSNPVTDAELESEYNKNVASTGTEYKARHILLKTEAEAKHIIAELDKGVDFAELAKTKSTGPSGVKGGDLGWFASGQMVAPFSNAVIALEDNKFTLEPVKTQFGYHVILREGSRSQTPPPFESVKDQILPMLQRKKLQEFMNSLRQQAEVEVLLPTTDALPSPTQEPTATKTEPTETASKATENTVENAKSTVAEEPAKAAEAATKAVDSTTKTVDAITQ